MKKLCFYSLIALMCCVSTTVRAYELEISGSYYGVAQIPLDGTKADQYQRCQTIYKSTELSPMVNKRITNLRFTTNKRSSGSWGRHTISFREVSASDLSSTSWITEGEPQVVYDGELNASQVYINLVLTTPYVYNGGNLLVEIIDHTTTDTPVETAFYCNKNGNSLHGSSATSVEAIEGTLYNYRPGVKFTYETPDNDKCPEPTDIRKTAISPTSASFEWTKGDNETEWQYVALLKGMALDWTNWKVKTATSTSATVTSLLANTNYVFYVRGNCGEDGYSKEAYFEFKTPCAEIAGEEIPKTFNFEDVTTGLFEYNIPDCWNRIIFTNIGSKYPYVGVSSTSEEIPTHSGIKGLCFYGGDPTSECMIILPLFTNTKDLAISFWYQNQTLDTKVSKYGKAVVGYITDPDDASTFVELEKLDQKAEMTESVKCSLSDTPQGAFIAVKFSGADMNNKSRLYIDDITIESATPTCSKPKQLEASSIKDVSASITWDKGAATSSVLEYKLSDAESWTVVENAVSPYDLSGLTSSSTYDVRVKNSCDEIGESGYVTTLFTTLCEIYQADAEHPYSENFEEVETGKIPDCWDNSESDSKWVPVWKKGLDTDASTSCVKLQNSDLSEKGYNLLKTQFVHINSAATLSFNYKNPYHAGLEVWYSIEGAEAVKLDDSFTTQANWTPYSKALPAACTKKDVQIIFKGIVTAEGSSEWPESRESYLSITDLLIECEETCPKPNITTVGVSGGSVEVEWNKGGEETEWLYICQPKSVELVNWESAKTSISTLVYVEGLEPLTDYVFYLRAKCSEDDQSGVVTSEFKTECGGAYKSYTTGFEASEGYVAGEYPECWTKMYVSGSEPEIDPVIATEGEGENVNQYLRVHGTGRQLIILPPFDKEIKDLQISFKYKLENNFNDLYVSFGTMSDLGGTDRFKALSQQPTYTSNTAEYQSLENFSLSTARSGDYYFAFFIQNPGGGRKPIFYLDNLVVEPAPVVPTAVENVESNVSAQKLMIDGQLYILHNGKIYTMQGQRVK